MNDEGQEGHTQGDGNPEDHVTGIWLATGIFAVFCLALFAVALRVGPRRGTWNQPAARFVPPGRGLAWTLYGFGLAHVTLGLAAAGAGRGGFSVGILLVAVAMGLFYVACGKVLLIARLVARGRDIGPVAG